jgi:hypothetical protein
MNSDLLLDRYEELDNYSEPDSNDDNHDIHNTLGDDTARERIDLSDVGLYSLKINDINLIIILCKISQGKYMKA